METLRCVAELHEYAQRTGSTLDYEDLGSVGPGHDKTFTLRVVLNGEAYPEGVGKNKKEAKRDAAKNALLGLLKNEQQDSTADEHCNPASSEQTEELNVSDICDGIRRLGVNLQLSRNKQRQTETKRDKQKQAETDTNKQRQSETETDKQKQTKIETNYIGLVDHYCQRKRRCTSYIEERRCGPSHDPQFFYIVMIDRKEYPEAEGKTVKEAKQNAARLAWFALQEETDWDSKVSVRSTVSKDGAPPTPSTPSASLESPSQSSPQTSRSTSITITDSSAPPEAQMSFRPAGPEQDAPTRLSTPSSLGSLESSQSMSVGTSGSEIFTDSSNSSKDQHAESQVKVKNMGNRQNETSNPSRFRTDFDPMECLGRGAFGCVYKAKHKLLLDKYFAVKIVRCEEKSLREVGTLSDLLHPNIVRYYTFWMEDSGYQWDLSTGSSTSSQSTDNTSSKYLYIQMELCDTKTLKVWIDERNTLSLLDSKRREESLNIVRQIVSGVQYIHSKKHIHRDLKPDNILFGLEGEVKIGDFGLVTKDDDDDDSALMERTGGRGTTSYMAPEQKGEKTYDRKVDIFALGLIYFELLWRLSTGHERVKVWDDVRSQKLPEEFSQIFPEEKQIIESTLCEKPEDRPEASSLKAELEKWTQT